MFVPPKSGRLMKSMNLPKALSHLPFFTLSTTSSIVLMLITFMSAPNESLSINETISLYALSAHAKLPKNSSGTPLPNFLRNPSKPLSHVMSPFSSFSSSHLWKISTLASAPSRLCSAALSKTPKKEAKKPFSDFFTAAFASALFLSITYS